MSFSTLYTDVGKVAKQLEVGLYNVKRVATYVRKLAELDESYVKDALKITKHEASKKAMMQV